MTALDDIPGLRGLVRLGEAFAVIPLVKRGLPEAKLAFENPTRARRRRRRVDRGHAAAPPRAGRHGGELASALIALAPALFALRGGELAAYHGVEHKAIAAYEADDEDARRRLEGARALRLAPDGADAGRQPRGHAAAQARARAARTPLAGGAVALASTAAAVEVFAWSERHADSPVTQALKRPGYELQRLIGTREPDERQLEVGRAALAEILRVEDSN